MQATIQVLLKEGKSRLTTTRIAERAGVSVGTLYQYFPNKSSLLQALLKQHLNAVASAVEAACRATHGCPLAAMAAAITNSFVQAKFSHIDASSALYAISDDVEGKRIAAAMHDRCIQSMAAVFVTASDATVPAPELVATTLLSAMAGVSRTMLEHGITRDTKATMQRELTVMVAAYLAASSQAAAPLRLPVAV